MAHGVTIRARQGDTLDALLWRETGSVSGIEAVLEANPGLAAAGDVLPEQHPVFVPAATAKAIADTPLVQLWD